MTDASFREAIVIVGAGPAPARLRSVSAATPEAVRLCLVFGPAAAPARRPVAATFCEAHP